MTDPVTDPARVATTLVAALPRRRPYGDPGLRRLRRGLGGVAGDGRARDQARHASVLQQPVTTTRRVVVAGLVPGAGTSTVAALLAWACAGLRGDPVVALDLTAEPGSLGWRLGTPPAVPLPSLPADGRLVPLLPQGAGRARVAEAAALGRALDPAGLLAALGRDAGIVVVDAGVLDGRRAYEQLPELGHATVLVAPLTLDGVRRARLALARLSPHAPVPADSTLLVLTAPSPASGTLRFSAAVSALDVAHCTVVRLSHDRHLAQGGPLEERRLGAGTRDVAWLAAAEALQRAARPGTGTGTA